jgi:3-isopropylmalate dehydrogenase
VSRIAVLPGDGIGSEVIEQGLRVLSVVAPDLTYEHFDLGADRYLRDGTTLPESVLQRFRNEFDAVYLGAFGDPRVPNNEHAKEILLGMRFRLDLYINFRPCKLLDDRYCPLRGKGRKEVNFVVFRENTEGMYTGIGGQFKRDSEDEIAIEQEINTRKGVERILRAAFDYARANGKKRVCMSDKANAMRHGHELWQRVYKQVAKDYPEIQASHLYVDVAAMKMVQTPEAFDVIVTNNLFGDILTDLGSALIGGLGLAASANINPGVAAMFEPVHGSAPDIAGKDLANPLAAMLTASLMLEHLGRKEAAARVEEAVRRCLEDGAVTRELGGNLGTAAAGDAVLARL